jgi:hypothetical protein
MSSIDHWTVARLVRRAANLMAESLWEYWPSNGKNEIPERNVTLHLGLALQQAGYRLYAEAHAKDATDLRVDLLAFNPEHKVTVVAECKRLYSPQKCAEMAEDLERLRSFIPREAYLGSKSFGVLAATTWQDDIVKWWSTADAAPPTEHPAWKKLHDGMKAARAHRGSVVLQTYEENSALSDHRFHHFLYAVFERPKRAD